MPTSNDDIPREPFTKDELADAIGGTWSVHPGTWRINWSDAARRIHGWRSPGHPTIWQALEFIEPHDRADLFAKALRCVELGHAFEAEVDLRTESGELKRVAVVGFAADEMQGRTVLHGTIRVVPGRLRSAAQSTSVAELKRIVHTWEVLGGALPHELRAPLMTIAGFAQAIATGEPAISNAARKRLERVVVAARHMDSLLDGLLRFTEISSTPPRREPVDVSVLALQCVDLLRDAEPGRDVEIHVQPGICVTGDPDFLRLAINNLLANAWKFTRRAADPRIHVETDYIGGRELLAVRDNGVGFDMRDAARLFVPFQKLHSGEQFAGAGLGLAIVRHAIERQMGNVWAHSSPGQGATFYVQL